MQFISGTEKLDKDLLVATDPAQYRCFFANGDHAKVGYT